MEPFQRFKGSCFCFVSLRNTVLSLERRSANLSDCYLGLAYIAASMKKLSRNFNQEFKQYCINQRLIKDLKNSMMTTNC